MLAQRDSIAAMFGTAAQRRETPEEEPTQRRLGGKAPSAPNAANGLPTQLRANIEALSGVDLSDVRVHRDSNRPAQLGALAYAQGSDIHLGPHQEQTLPHEAWHVVQQRQGRVRPTIQMAGVGVNDDKSLEDEADRMGARAASLPATDSSPRQLRQQRELTAIFGPATAPVQRALPPGKPNTADLYGSTNDAKTKVYHKGRPVTFSTAFKKKLLLQWQDTGRYSIMHSKEGNKEYVRTATSKSDMFADWVPIGAFQIDHVYPWDSIESDLWKRAEEIQGEVAKTYPAKGKLKKVSSKLQNDIALTAWEDDCYLLDSTNDKNYTYFSTTQAPSEKQRYADEIRSGDTMVWPTMYAARLYFHEFKNLQPMQGSENAGKGAKVGVNQPPAISQDQAGVESFVTRKYLSIIDSVQNAFHEYSNTKSKKLYQGLLGAWGKKGKALTALNVAEAAAKSSSTGAPSTPERLGKMTIDEVQTPEHL